MDGESVYADPLVILIDALSYSCSEWFATGMQSIGWAKIIGERSPGGAIAMNVRVLRNGALLGYPVAQLLTPDGRVLEGYGVIPDIAVSLDRRHLLGVAITNLLAGESLLSGIHLSPKILLATLITFASVFFYSGGINEEGGWRGFAQRRLQANYSPLVANLLLWAYLVVWHIPNDIIQYREGGYLLVRIGLYPFITILFGWVYNRTRGSILALALFHASMNSMNTLGAVLPVTIAGSVLLVLLAVFAVLVDRMWKKLPTDHPAVYPEGDTASQRQHLTASVIGKQLYLAK